METISEVKNYIPFNPVRKGFYRNNDVFYFIDNLFQRLEIAGIIIIKIIHTRHLKAEVDKAEVFTSEKKYDHKLTVTIDENSLISYKIETLNSSSTKAWQEIDHKSNITIEKWNENEFNSIVNLIKI